MNRHLRITVPTEGLRRTLAAEHPEHDIATWDLSGPVPHSLADLVVQPYMSPTSLLAGLDPARVSAVQGLSIGFESVDRDLAPGIRYCNAAGVHEAPTAEIALALILAQLRGIPEFVRAQDSALWRNAEHPGLIGRSVLLVGYGGIGQALELLLEPFGVEVERVATTARTVAGREVHAISELPTLLGRADVVVLAVPLNDTTTRLANADFFAAMRSGALVVNVSRGAVVDTEALCDAVRQERIRAAVDVTDPEPLPSDHPLWTLPGVLISPHVGGRTGTMYARVEKLLREQVERLGAGRELLNRVL